MRNVQLENLSAAANETINTVKHALGADKIYPSNPNIVLLTDNTTLFVFESKSVQEIDKEW